MLHKRNILNLIRCEILSCSRSLIKFEQVWEHVFMELDLDMPCPRIHTDNIEPSDKRFLAILQINPPAHIPELFEHKLYFFIRRILSPTDQSLEFPAVKLIELPWFIFRLDF